MSLICQASTIITGTVPKDRRGSTARTRRDRTSAPLPQCSSLHHSFADQTPTPSMTTHDMGRLKRAERRVQRPRVQTKGRPVAYMGLLASTPAPLRNSEFPCGSAHRRPQGARPTTRACSSPPPAFPRAGPWAGHVLGWCLHATT